MKMTAQADFPVSSSRTLHQSQSLTDTCTLNYTQGKISKRKPTHVCGLRTQHVSAVHDSSYENLLLLHPTLNTATFCSHLEMSSLGCTVCFTEPLWLEKTFSIINSNHYLTWAGLLLCHILEYLPTFASYLNIRHLATLLCVGIVESLMLSNWTVSFSFTLLINYSTQFKRLRSPCTYLQINKTSKKSCSHHLRDETH